MKKAATIVLSILVFLSTTVPAFAEKAETIPVHNDTTETQVMLRTEQTKWYYRTNNGKHEKRLWSLTYACWLTEWIPA